MAKDFEFAHSPHVLIEGQAMRKKTMISFINLRIHLKKNSSYKIILFILAIGMLTSCSSPFLKHEEPTRLSVDDEIPEIQIKEMGEDPNINKRESGAVLTETENAEGALPSAPSPLGELRNKETSVMGSKSKNPKKGKKAKKETSKGGTQTLTQQKDDELQKSTSSSKESNTVSSGETKRREPLHESSVGFSPGSRRPEKDPFRVGEKVVMSVRYFRAQAGELTLEVKPMVEVNGRKSYRWYSGLRTTGLFSRFYSIEDWAETLVDFETLIPSVYTLQVKESAQLKNGKGYFNSNNLKAVYAEKKYTEKKGHEEKHQEWQIAPYSQNVFSAAFYMRIFNYEVGKEYKFYVSDDEKNLMFKGKALRREKVSTDAGVFETIVVKPEFELNGVFKPVGDIFFWLTDDDRKLIVRIESEIKIGTLVMEAIRVERGE